MRLPFGVNVLWDAKASLAWRAPCTARFVREVFTGVYESDMGLFAPPYGDLAAYRHAIGADDVAIFANITPEFSRSVSDRPVADRARGAAYMGVDALLISGVQAGVSADWATSRPPAGRRRRARARQHGREPRQRAARCCVVADGVIVGTSLKVDGSTWNAVDPERARRLVSLAHSSAARAA